MQAYFGGISLFLLETIGCHLEFLKQRKVGKRKFLLRGWAIGERNHCLLISLGILRAQEVGGEGWGGGGGVQCLEF